MELETDRSCCEVLVSGTAAELAELARVVAAGEGFIGSVPCAGGLTGVEGRRRTGPGVLVHLDAERQVLLISGDQAGRTLLGEIIQDTAEADDGGHVHIDWFPGHYYLVEGSIALVLDSPLGGTPLRR
ncbi:hypothetical protein OHV05_13970 [Kitasatospora sp. NBC_00070]|uniref:Imm32 family immunity protein n=1 Tax=Kitasatospora sp. NBC_00070 TaxID=2975962 RepID=UPI003246B03C